MEIHETKDYRDALAKVRSWRKRIAKADADETRKILQEKREFFDHMEETNPQLYSIFRISDKELSEMAIERFTGTPAIID